MNVSCENNGLVERLLKCEKNLEDFQNDLQSWTDSLEELSEIENAFKTDGKFRIRGKKVLDVGTDCVKPLYIALKFKPNKIVGINEKLPSVSSNLEQESRFFTKTKIRFHNFSFFNDVMLDRILKEEGMDRKFDFVLVSKTLHHLRTEECIREKRDKEHEHQEDETEKCCIYGFETRKIFEKLLKLGKRVIVYETYFPQEEDKDKVRGRGGYFTTKEWEKILTSISVSEKYKVEFITPIKCHLTNKELKNIIAKLNQVDYICFYVEEQDVKNSKRLIAKTKR
jgi:hypothetical protein